MVSGFSAQNSDSLDGCVVRNATLGLGRGLGNGALLALDLLDLGRRGLRLGEGVGRLAALGIDDAREIVIVEVSEAVKVV
jgi:hypothetical protein